MAAAAAAAADAPVAAAAVGTTSTTSTAAEEKALEKARKAASKEVVAAFKQWAGMVKSKDVKQLLSVSEQLQDQLFLTAGGGLAALVKAVGAKDAEPKAAALYQLAEVVAPRGVDELPDDIAAPPAAHVARACIVVQLLGASGAAVRMRTPRRQT